MSTHVDDTGGWFLAICNCSQDDLSILPRRLKHQFLGTMRYQIFAGAADGDHFAAPPALDEIAPMGAEDVAGLTGGNDEPRILRCLEGRRAARYPEPWL